MEKRGNRPTPSEVAQPFRARITVGEPNSELSKLDAIAAPIRDLARALAPIFEQSPIVGRIILNMIAAPETNLAGQVVMEKRDVSTNHIDVEITGDLGRELAQTPKGHPVHADFKATVFFQAGPNRPRYAKTGDIVHTGQRVLWAMENKNSGEAVEAPITGKITYKVNDGDIVLPKRTQLKDDGCPELDEKGNPIEIPGTILFYIEP